MRAAVNGKPYITSRLFLELSEGDEKYNGEMKVILLLSDKTFSNAQNAIFAMHENSSRFPL